MHRVLRSYWLGGSLRQTFSVIVYSRGRCGGGGARAGYKTRKDNIESRSQPTHREQKLDYSELGNVAIETHDSPEPTLAGEKRLRLLLKPFLPFR